VSRTLRRAGVAAVAGALTLAVLWPLLPKRGSEATVETVDTGAELVRLLAEREALQGSAASDSAELALQGDAALDASGSERLVRGALEPDVARLFYPSIGRGDRYDPLMFSRREPNVRRRVRLAEHPNGGWWLVTNSLGMRDDEPRAERPDRRVIVVGDSHVDGVCDNAESYPNRLEVELERAHPEVSIEVLNAGQGGWNLWNYLGALEAYLPLDPDAFVVTIYGGNDFVGTLGLWHFFRGKSLRREARRITPELKRLGELHPGIVPQFLEQVAYFQRAPDEVAVAVRVTEVLLDEMRSLCEREGIALVVVYLPPLAEVQAPFFSDALEHARADLALTSEQELVSSRIADAVLTSATAAGVAVVDLRPAFRAHGQRLYWQADHHIGVAGHALAADVARPVLERALGL
jgi:hypothetical protein